MRITALLLLLMTLCFHARAQDLHDPWDALLSQYVDQSGGVDYEAWNRGGVNELDGYLSDLAGTDYTTFRGNEALAFWINVYNAFTVKLILDNYPISSIKDIYDGNPWDVKWISLREGMFSLNQIEHEIIRPAFEEPLIHFGVNCAAKSCPPLANQAYFGENVSELLEKQARSFINNDRYNRIRSKGTSYLSMIFKWYSGDFDPLHHFINTYSDVRISSDANIQYLDYDWALNRAE